MGPAAIMALIGAALPVVVQGIELYQKLQKENREATPEEESKIRQVTDTLFAETRAMLHEAGKEEG